MSKTLCLKVWGDFACFTRPEMKVERVSYDVITPSAARAIFEAILWKPEIRWTVTKIEVLKPIKWISVRRNEIGKVASTNSITNQGDRGLYIEDHRQQRAGLFLRDVAYRLHARFEVVDGSKHIHRYPELMDQFSPE
ncbi:MAG: type I-C CRISPR-associated protein Cas5c, partial [Gammaproteobacteria bacterium]|nr:type I-C CRISPR-associated protein Cas5c [Gammaproteobacteria bacterium]